VVSRRPAALLIALLTLISSCAGGDVEPTQVFRYADTEPEYLDPTLCAEISGLRIVMNLFEGLTCFPPDDGPARPAVATHWEVDESGTLWTFHLREDAVWSDGTPLTAEDFVYAWRRAVDPANSSKVAQYLWYIRNGRSITSGRLPPTKLGVTALDDHTLMVELEEPTPYLLDLVAFPGFAPVPRHVVGAKGSRWVRPENMVTNGPYTLSEWAPLDHITLQRNPLYFDADDVELERVEVFISDDSATRYKMYVAGEIDWLFQLPAAYIPSLKHKRTDFHIAPYLATYFYTCNLSRPPLDDSRVRKALNLAIDKETIVQYVTKAEEDPATSLVPPMPNYTGPMGGTFDPDQARRLLADAGYPNGVGFPTIQMSFNAMDVHELVAQVIQEMWKTHLNITVELQSMQWKVYLQRMQVGDFDLARSGWIGDYPDPMAFLETFDCGASNNNARYCNRDFEALLNQVRSEEDATRRRKLLYDAEEILIQDLPLIPIFHYSLPYLLREDVEGFEENTRDFHLAKYMRRRSPGTGP
jgi:oligopeptide transport system substrate-binding protein